MKSSIGRTADKVNRGDQEGSTGSLGPCQRAVHAPGVGGSCGAGGGAW